MNLKNGGRTLDAIETTLDIVGTIQESNGATLAELVAAMDYPKSTIYYHVNTLRTHGYLVTEGDRYHVGLRFLTHGAHAKRRKKEYTIIDRKLRDLAEETTAETDFAAEENGRLVVLSQRISGSDQSGFLEGNYLYLTASSAGKAILAEMSDAEIDAVIDQWGLPQETDNSITDREALFDEIETVRDRGYAVSDEELLTGLRSVSAVVHDNEGSVLGSISISGPKYRFTMETIHGQIVEQLRQSISELEEEMTSIEDSENT